MVGSGGAGSTGTYGRNTTGISQAAESVMSPSSYRGGKGQEGVPAPATTTFPIRCRADLAGGHSGTYGFCRLVPRQLQANAVTGVPFLLLHVLEIPQVTVCSGISREGEGSRKAQSWLPQPCPPGTPKASTHGPSLGRCWEMGTAGGVCGPAMASPQIAPGEWERAPGVTVPTLDTRMQLSLSFPRAPQELLLSAGTLRPAWHPPSGTPERHSGLATRTELLKERLHEAGAIAQGRRVDVHVVHVLP